MILFLYGPDVYRMRQKIKEIVKRYQQIRKSGLNLKFFEGEELNFQTFKNEFQTVPMFKEKKLFVIKEISKNENFKKRFLKEIKKFALSKDLILFWEKEIKKEDEFLKKLKENSKWQKFELLPNLKLALWIKKEIKKYQGRIEDSALKKLIEFVGNDLWQLSQEIKKLISYTDGRKIKKEDVELLVKPKIEANIFKALDALSQRNKEKAFNLFHQYLEKGESPLYLLAMINLQIRNLLIFKSTGKLNSHPYIVKKTIQQSKNFSLEELKKLYQRMLQLDFEIKRGRISPEIALDLLIAEI